MIALCRGEPDDGGLIRVWGAAEVMEHSLTSFRAYVINSLSPTQVLASTRATLGSLASHNAGQRDTETSRDRISNCELQVHSNDGSTAAMMCRG